MESPTLTTMEEDFKSSLLQRLSKIKVTLPNGENLKPYLVEDEDDLKALYPTIQSIATNPKQKEQPFAADEFPEEEHFMEYAESGFVLEFRGSTSGKPEAYGFVTPSLFHRVPRPFYADLRVCILKTEISMNILKTFLSCLVKIAEIIGYLGCIAETFIFNLETMEAARQNGFHNVMIIPLSGILAGKDYTYTLLFFKQLCQPDKPFPDPESDSVQHLPESRFRVQARRPLPEVFPLATTLQDGTKLIIRKLETRHIPLIQQITDEAVARGHGYGASDIPPTEVLQEVVDGVNPGHGFAAELPSGRTIGIIYIGPHQQSRSQNPTNSDCYVVVDQTFGGKGLGTFFCRLWNSLSYQMGYRGCLTDTFLNNIQVLRLARTCKYLHMGTIWRGGHLTGKGFADTVSFFRETFKGDPEQCQLSNI